MLLWALFLKEFCRFNSNKIGYSRNDVDGFAVNSQNELHLQQNGF
jgi:hypothetical protein